MKGGMYQVIVPPRGPLYIRKDEDTGTVWISRDLLKRELMAGSASYHKMKQEMAASRALLSDNKRVVLGKGTEYAGMAEICWEIDLKNPVCGQAILQLTRRQEDEKILQAR
jgi:hypothetical protein